MKLFHIHKWGPWSEPFGRDVLITRGPLAGTPGRVPCQSRKCIKCNKTGEKYV